VYNTYMVIHIAPLLSRKAALCFGLRGLFYMTAQSSFFKEFCGISLLCCWQDGLLASLWLIALLSVLLFLPVRHLGSRLLRLWDDDAQARLRR